MDTKSLCFDNTITRWDEGLPLGNGDLGCLIWDRADRLRFSLDKGGLWDCSNPPEAQADFTWQNMQTLIHQGKWRALSKKYDDCYNRPTPTKLPAGKLILDLGETEEVRSRLDLMTAEATVQVGSTVLRALIAANAPYGLIQINKTGVSLRIENPAYGSGKKPLFAGTGGTVQSLKNLVYPKATFYEETVGEDQYRWFVQPTNDRFYGIVTAVRQQDRQTLIAYTVGAGESADFVKESKELLAHALRGGYAAAREAHIAWWRSFWQKSEIQLPDPLLEKHWYLNNYLLGSGSRKGFLPMPLQGLWTADNGSLPPWKGDYHHDLNTQMTYTSYLKANRLEQGECFIDFLLQHAESARRFAKTFYHARGLCLPSVMDVKGQALGGWCQYALSPTNQLWLCQIMARYWYYTQNSAYFEKIYAYMTEVGQFLLDILEEKDGVYRLPLSTSPEIHDNSPRAWLTPNTNYDLALMRTFAMDMIRLSRIAQNDEAAARWETVLDKLEPLAVGADGVLLLSSDERLQTSHRHHSHCMSIYPLRELGYTTAENRRIIDATIENLERLGSSEWVGYSFGWMAQLYIARGDGDKARELLQKFFSCLCTPNGFHANGDFQIKLGMHMTYRLFTLEGNFLATDAIQEMLLYSEWGRIRLFPAVPRDWTEIGFSCLRAFGGVLVSARLEKGKICAVTLKAEADTAFVLENDLSHLSASVPLPPDGKITLRRGETVTFS